MLALTRANFEIYSKIQIDFAYHNIYQKITSKRKKYIRIV